MFQGGFIHRLVYQEQVRKTYNFKSSKNSQLQAAVHFGVLMRELVWICDTLKELIRQENGTPLELALAYKSVS